MDPFLGEIRIFAGNFAPRGWALCDGQLVPISQNTALFSILGVQYGGDGRTNFALPDFQGRAPVQQGQGPGLTVRNMGEPGGESYVVLKQSEIPPHSHVPNSQSVSNGVADPTNAVWTNSSGLSGQKVYGTTADSPMSPQAIQVTGGSQPHNNSQPYLGLTYIIALEGIFPPRN
jgi:microcystin-dependent protein